MNKQRQIVLEPREKELPNFSKLLINVGQNQDKAAFADIFQHFAPRVKSYMLKLGSVDEVAEELAQQTLLKVWRKAQLFGLMVALAFAILTVFYIKFLK